MSQELKSCPFCGCSIRLESNHDWHRLQGEHDDACPFSNRDETLMAAATDSQLALLFHDWNRRHDAQQPEAVPSGLHEKDIYDFAGWLTSRPGVMEVGCTSWACPMADAVVEYIKTFPQRFAPAQQPAGDVVMDAERWRYALESDDFAVCKWETIFGEEGWFPISETSEIDAAIDSARKGE